MVHKWTSNGPRKILKSYLIGPQNVLKTTLNDPEIVLQCSSNGTQMGLKRSTKSSKGPQEVLNVLKRSSNSPQIVLKRPSKGSQMVGKCSSIVPQVVFKWFTKSSKSTNGDQRPQSLKIILKMSSKVPRKVLTILKMFPKAPHSPHYPHNSRSLQRFFKMT